MATGTRRGDALALRWEDVEFSSRQITIRRAITQRRLTTPKSGKARTVTMAGGLAADLFDLGAQQRVDAMRKGWPEVPQWVLCSEVGTPWDERNLERAWARVRRRAQKMGVRPLKLHTARHTFATLALEAGRSLRWVAEQLGHSDPALTLRVYAHALRSTEADLAFVDFGSAASGGDKGGPVAPESVSSRLQTALDGDGGVRESCNSLEILARREGFEPPTLRFEGLHLVARSMTCNAA